MAKIVLMGDSITEYMPYVFKGTIGTDGDEVKYFGVENMGVGSYMMYAWPKVDHEDVDTYILLIGINNICRPDCDYDGRESIDELINKLKSFINQIVESSNAKLFVQSIYPTNCTERINSIKIVNQHLKAHCGLIGVEYLDLYSLLVNEDELFDERYTNDGIHPNELGYNIIANEINKRLKNGLCKKLLHRK